MKFISIAALLLYTIWRFGVIPASDRQSYNDTERFIISGDARDYVQLAESLAERGEYNKEQGEKPYSLRTPGFPIFLMFLMKIAGGKWLLTLFVCHTVLAATTVFIVYHIVTNLRGHNAGLFAGFLTASYAPYHYIAFIVYREMLCLALFSVMLLLLSPGFYRRHTFIILGFLVGIMGLVREEFILLILPCLLLVWYKENNGKIKDNLRTVVIKSAAMCGLVLLVFLPWITRNWMEFHKFQVLGTLGGVQLYMGNNQNITPDYQYDYGYVSRIPEYRDHTDHEVDKIYFRRAVIFALNHPFLTLRNMAFKLRILYTCSIRNLDDFLLFFAGLFAGTGLLVFYKKKNLLQRQLILLCAALFFYVSARGWNMLLFLPNVEFGVLKYFGITAFFIMLFRKELPLYSLCYFLLFLVNMIFVPQHRQRWIIDLIFIIWTAMIIYDSLKFLENKFKLSFPGKDAGTG